VVETGVDDFYQLKKTIQSTDDLCQLKKAIQSMDDVLFYRQLTTADYDMEVRQLPHIGGHVLMVFDVIRS
jgi:hypothetical protein